MVHRFFYTFTNHKSKAKGSNTTSIASQCLEKLEDGDYETEAKIRGVVCTMYGGMFVMFCGVAAAEKPSLVSGF